MQLLPYIKNHMNSKPQKFHFLWSSTTAVIKKTNSTSIKNLAAQIIFYVQKFTLEHVIL